ncbi:hypothetical protein [Bacteriophage sp.]|nr:hypothetical protein [Bacteriophage sp.]UOF80108.1 hypothetical protein [Bacteriophage sp.]
MILRRGPNQKKFPHVRTLALLEVWVPDRFLGRAPKQLRRPVGSAWLQQWRG